MNESGTNPGYHRWLRRPDKAFWLDILSAAPAATETDGLRRARLARYALGIASLSNLPYIFCSLLIAPFALRYLIILNIATLATYGCGMWAASLGAHQAARMWLMATLTAQLALLQWLTGPALGVSAFAFVLAALASVLFTSAEKGYRCFFIGSSLLILLVAHGLANTLRMDLSALSPALLALTRIGNQVTAFACILMLLGVFEREVLRSESGLVAERDRSNRLLHVILPKKIAGILQHTDGMIANHHPDVTVMFADIAGFTPWASAQTPEAVVNLLEQVFSRFDTRVAAVGAEKIKTIGDAYMVISGAPEPRTDHALIIARLAQDFMHEVELLKMETGIPLALRIGINSGPVIAGVIGTVRFSYDVWGDTVNTASRMESQGEPGKIHVSAETRSRIANAFHLENRGSIEVKGKGSMDTWWLGNDQKENRL
jgi:class 3 adenylate cyclase